MLTANNLKAIMPLATMANINKFLPILNEMLPKYGIDTPKRQAAFLGQIAHESQSFLYVKECASGKAYEGRKDLGNTCPGDGVKYKGRGLIELSGKFNYRRCGQKLGVDLVSNPEWAETPEGAVAVSCWFWDEHDLNVYADEWDIHTISHVTNGGWNGLDQRIQFSEAALHELAPAS